MKSFLAGNKRLGALGGMCRGPIHHHDQMSAGMVFQQLTQKGDNLRGRDSFFVQSEYQRTALSNGGQSRNPTPFSRHRLLRRMTFGGPSLSQHCRQRNHRFIFKIQNCLKFLHRSLDLRNLLLQPLFSLLLVRFEVPPLGLLVCQPAAAQHPPHRRLRQANPQFPLRRLDQSSACPQIRLITIMRCGAKHNLFQFPQSLFVQYPFASTPWLSLKGFIPPSLLPPIQPSVEGGSMNLINGRNIADRIATSDCFHCPLSDIIGGISLAHAYILSHRSLLSRKVSHLL